MIQLYHAYIRKTAHFAEYAVLAFWASWAFNRPTVGRARTMIYGLLAVVTVAAIDEYNQSFNLSRTGSWLDVLLDISGGVTMLAIFWISNRLRPSNTAERTPN